MGDMRTPMIVLGVVNILNICLSSSLMFGWGPIKPLGIDEKRLNICGGGIALGHPIGGSGARVLTTLIHQLHRTGGKRGVAALCLGGGNSVAMVIEV